MAGDPGGGGAARPAPTEATFRAAAAAELAAAEPQSGLDGGNGFKIPLVARAIAATLRQLAPEA